MGSQRPALWLAIVAAVLLFAVFSWQAVAIAAVSVACFMAYTALRPWRPSSPRCLKCGGAMKSTERWCKDCGSASYSRG